MGLGGRHPEEAINSSKIRTYFSEFALLKPALNG
jgi:hypothetical protein